jgi:hypothetical protein
MNDLLLPITMLLSITVMAALLAMLPVLQSQAAPLGVRVPTNYSNHTVVLKAIRGYRLVLLASWLVALAISILFWSNPLAVAFASIIVAAGSVFGYAWSRRQIIAAKKAEGWFQDATFSISGRISSDQLPAETAQGIATLPIPRTPWISIISSLGIAAAAAITVAARWSEIPATVATHWGPKLQPDAWEPKSITSVFFTTFALVALVILLSGLTALMTRAHVHSRSDRSTKGQIKLQVQLAAANIGLGLLVLILSATMAFSQVVSALPAYQHLVPLAFILIILGSFGSIIALLATTLSYQSKADEALRNIQFGDEDKESPDNDEHFKFGMFYYNPDDPAVLVEKRYGTGVDFNYATWQGKAFLTVIIAVLIFAVAAPFIF